MVAGLMPTHFVAPLTRWGTQKRYKCKNCTCYMAKPQENGEMVCSRCGSFYRPYGPDLYAMVVPDDVTP